MATGKQSIRQNRRVVVEELVDLFLDDRIDQHNVFGPSEADSVTDQDSKASIFGETESDVVTSKDPNVLGIGRTLADMGDELWKEHQASMTVTRDDVRSMLNKITGKVAMSGNEEQEWQKFKEILDKALRDSGANSPMGIAGAVLVTIKGISSFGGAVRNLARRFTLRFIDERGLREDIERISEINLDQRK